MASKSLAPSINAIAIMMVYHCAECDHIDVDCAGPLYKCATCDNQFNADMSPYGTHQCASRRPGDTARVWILATMAWAWGDM